MLSANELAEIFACVLLATIMMRNRQEKLQGPKGGGEGGGSPEPWNPRFFAVEPGARSFLRMEP